MLLLLLLFVLLLLLQLLLLYTLVSVVVIVFFVVAAVTEVRSLLSCALSGFRSLLSFAAGCAIGEMVHPQPKRGSGERRGPSRTGFPRTEAAMGGKCSTGGTRRGFT